MALVRMRVQLAPKTLQRICCKLANEPISSGLNGPQSVSRIE